MIDKKYEELFRSEVEEIINNLEKNILKLEENPESEESLNEIFRAAHTLKGMAAAVDKKEIEKFCHKFEDELDEIRKGKKKLKDFDFLFKAVDALKLMLEGKKAPSFEEIKRGEKKKEQVYSIKLYVEPDTPLIAARLFVILKDIKNFGEILSSEPDEEEIKRGEVSNELKITLKSELKKEEIKKFIDEFPDIEHVFIEEKEYKEKVKEFEIKPLEEVKVKAEKLDILVDRLGEIVIAKERLFSKIRNIEDREIQDAMENLDRLIGYLQDDVMSMRLIPAIQIFERFPRYVRDKSKEMGKEAEIIIEGGEIELDRILLEEMKEPLLHIIRNSLDHGIEKPEERIRKGKSRKGKIFIRLEREKNSVNITIEDDGRGIDTDKVIQRAITRGLISKEKASSLKKNEILELLTLPGFSTKEGATELSGRGIGLDVVKQFITKLGGKMDIESEFGKGTKILLKLPLSLAITRALVVEVNSERFVIPLVFVQEIIERNMKNIKKLLNREYLLIRNEILPAIWMGERLGRNGKKPDRFTALLIESEGKRACLLVDRVISQMDVVVKSLDVFLMRVPYISGGTILWDGKPSIIVDPSKFMER